MPRTEPQPGGAAATPALRFDAVAKDFRGRTALDAVSFEVRAGETFALVGVNGAGKTTLLRCLLDFCRPAAGAMEIFGISSLHTRARAPLAYLPERFTPPHYLSGETFLRYVTALDGRAHDPAAAAALLADLELDPAALHRPARALSKGMTQKLGLAACLLRDKPLVILDEPTSGLDPRARALFKQQVHRLRERGRTVLFTSHALADVDELADRMAVLHAGQLRFCGPPAALRGTGTRSLEQAFLERIQ